MRSAKLNREPGPTLGHAIRHMPCSLKPSYVQSRIIHNLGFHLTTDLGTASYSGKYACAGKVIQVMQVIQVIQVIQVMQVIQVIQVMQGIGGHELACLRGGGCSPSLARSLPGLL